mmetsp:Transcript_99719/g.253525  ORF Transcript_99719/g.253525 Transcript_99719/m.253525 type:complete len:388 (-) Transcript_99719:198-1361(-)
MKSSSSTKMHAAVVALACASLLEVGEGGQVARRSAPIVPPLENVASHKKFFGPPFPADYTDDLQPSADDLDEEQRKHFYPHLQHDGYFDRDYVKDENNDGGEWSAQMAYDNARSRYNKENQLSEEAKERLVREAREAEEARRRAEEALAAEAAARIATDAAQEAAKAAGADEDEYHDLAKKAQAARDKLDAELKSKHLSKSEVAARLAEIEKELAEAEAAFKKSQANFKECERQLAAAREAVAKLQKEFNQLKNRQAVLSGGNITSVDADDMTDDLARARAKREAADTAHEAAKERVAKANSNVEYLKKVVEEQRGQEEDAAEDAEKQKQDVDRAQVEYEAARKALKNLREGPPAPSAAVMPKNGSPTGTALSAVVVFLSVCLATWQ